MNSVSSPSPLVLIEKDGPATTVLTLNRPAKRNALNLELLAALCLAVAAAEKDPAQRVLILQGAGPVFCAGLDLDEAADPDRASRSAELVARSLLALSQTSLATIAVVHGAALAGGAGLMSACDFAVATADAKIGYPEPRRGLVAALVMTFLRRQLRERDARELLLTGEPVSAAAAREIGLVNRVVSDLAAARAEAKKFAAAVMQGAPPAVAHTKQLLADLWPRSVPDDLAHALNFHQAARHSPEAQEGLAAFREKRPPRWAPK